MKRQLSMILALTLLLSLLSCTAYAVEAPAGSDEPGQTIGSDPAGAGREPEGSDHSGEFRDDLFSDVKKGSWFYSHVKAAYELGLMKGRGGGLFAPHGSINLAEVITIAARLRSAYLGDGRDLSGGKPWYAAAVEYAIAQGIIKKGDFANYTVHATRAQVAYILSRALPSGALAEINTVEDNSLPDVKTGDAYAANIYSLYRVGILKGTDKKGTFSPSGVISRAEAAAMATRIADPSLRVKCEFFAPPPPTYPDLSLKPRADDSFFADTAILGNSLIDGLRLYAKLKTVDYYCGTSMSVVSALNTKNVLLKNGAYGTQIDAMAQKQYGKVYIELGINEIGGSVTTYISRYRTLLDKIRAAQPNADIYIMAITPTSRSKVGTSFSKDRVVMYNNALYQLAAEWGCWYLDDYTPLADSEGYLPSAETWDGVHFTPKKYSAWEEFIRTHYA